jgi:hypothetical protein
MVVCLPAKAPVTAGEQSFVRHPILSRAWRRALSPRVPPHARPAQGASSCERGQSLVEFALVFPIFLMLLMGIIEFAFIFNAQLALNYATRDAALVAAEAGAHANADCLILRQVDTSLMPPTNDSSVISVRIFSATETGSQLSPAVEQVYTRGGSTTCGSITVPYTRTTNAYPYNVRCSDLDRTGCDPAKTGPGNTGVDIIGVRIDYRYTRVGPFGFDSTMIVSNEMRMEPIL